MPDLSSPDCCLGPATGHENYGKKLGLTRKQQTLQADVQNYLIVSPVTKKHGLFWMTPQAIRQTVATLAKAGTPVKAGLFSNELLAEIYHGRRSLPT